MAETSKVSQMLGQVHERLAEAQVVAKAAHAVANEGWSGRALQMALDVEPLIHEANHLLQAASVLNR